MCFVEVYDLLITIGSKSFILLFLLFQKMNTRSQGRARAAASSSRAAAVAEDLMGIQFASDYQGAASRRSRPPSGLVPLL